MKTVVVTVFLGFTALILAACGSPAKNASRVTSADTKPAAAATTADALLALEKQANDAYLKGDWKFFEGILSEKFVTRQNGQQLDKTDVVKMIVGNKCDVKDWKLEDPHVARIDAGTYVLSYKGTFAGTCAGRNGKSIDISSPIRAATVWVRTGSTWQAAFHGQNLLSTANNAPSAQVGSKNEELKKMAYKVAENSNTAATTPAADPNTATMMAVETSVWEAWVAKDARKLEGLTTSDLSFQNIFGTFFANKADTIKDWTGATCDIKTVSVTDGAGTLLAPTVGMLSRTGTAEGSCDGHKLASVPIYGTSIFVKDGDSWKLAFTLNRLD